MQLNDADILELCRTSELVRPFDMNQLQPATYDMRLNFDIMIQPVRPFIGLIYEAPIDPENPVSNLEPFHIDTEFLLSPGSFVLASTMETVSLPANIAGRVDGKSSLGRLGLIVHSTAGFIDPGFKGNVTLEITNINNRRIILHPGMLICQMSFIKLTGNAERPYGHPDLKSRYQNQVGVQGAKAKE